MKTVIGITLLLSVFACAVSSTAFLKVSKFLSSEKPSQVQSVAQAPAVLCEDNNDQNTCHTP